MTTEDPTTLTWHPIGRLEDLAEGQIHAVRVDGQVYAVVRDGANGYALENDCPHRGGPLAGGRLVNGEVACPWHGFRFNPSTGAATAPTEHSAATCRPVRVTDGQVEIAT